MYTIEEIKKEARSAQRKTIPLLLIIGVIDIAVLYFLTKFEFAHYNPYNTHTLYYLQVGFIFIVFIFALFLPQIAYNNKKKQLEEENAEEERMKREEHYKKIEKMLERQSIKD